MLERVPRLEVEEQAHPRGVGAGAAVRSDGLRYGEGYHCECSRTAGSAKGSVGGEGAAGRELGGAELTRLHRWFYTTSIDLCGQLWRSFLLPHPEVHLPVPLFRSPQTVRAYDELTRLIPSPPRIEDAAAPFLGTFIQLQTQLFFLHRAFNYASLAQVRQFVKWTLASLMLLCILGGAAMGCGVALEIKVRVQLTFKSARMP